MSTQISAPGASGSTFTVTDGVCTASGGFVGAVTGLASSATTATNVGDKVVTAVVALGASGAGVATKALTLTLKRADAATAVASARAVMIRSFATAEIGSPIATPVATVTFGTATVGSILVAGPGFAIVLTNAAGAFACTCTDSADEEVVFAVSSAAMVTDIANTCECLPSAYVSATWA